MRTNHRPPADISETKAAIRSLARTLTAELSAKGIRTNAHAPGFIDTESKRKVGMSEKMIQAINAQAQSEVPMGRIGVGDDIASVVLFLFCDNPA